MPWTTSICCWIIAMIANRWSLAPMRGQVCVLFSQKHESATRHTGIFNGLCWKWWPLMYSLCRSKKGAFIAQLKFVLPYSSLELCFWHTGNGEKQWNFCMLLFLCLPIFGEEILNIRSLQRLICMLQSLHKLSKSYPQDKVPSRKKATQTASPWAWWKNRTDSLLISPKGCHLFPWPILSIIVDEILRLTLLHLEKRNKLPTVNPILYLQLDTSDCAENWNTSQAMFLHVLN